jgi:NAD(P)-dependent dehydrogenase (short-subunit alcohol dehydrogenase family)
MGETWLITGSSRGLGRALAEAALEAGDQVVATARHPEQLTGIVYRRWLSMSPIRMRWRLL